MRLNGVMFYLAKAYSFIYGYAKDHAGVHIPGLGFALRLVRSDRIIAVMGRKMYFNHKVASSYARTITGRWNEPETHLLLNYLISRLPGSVVFVDVGANIGEMVIDVCRHENVVEVLAFEPIPACCSSIRESLKLSEIENCNVVQKLVGATVGKVRFAIGRDPQTSSVVSPESSITGAEIEMTTLDAEPPAASDHAIILIDVEGYEPSVMKGAKQFIEARKPLIIFEYNSASKASYSLAEIKEILGSGYDVYRLRPDGRLDGEVEKAWNCVAIPSASMIKKISDQLVVAGST